MRPPESWRSARVTLVIAGVTAAAWLLAFGSGQADFLAYWAGFVPAQVGSPPESATAHVPFWIAPLTATLVHAGLIHLFFNLLIHLFCGRSVETIIGGRGLAILYIAGAYAAAAAQYAFAPDEQTPMVGASGAISAILGAYAMLFGKNRVRTDNLRLAVWLNALWLAVAWVILQTLVGFTFETSGIRIAIAAHIGGFFAGLLLASPLLLLRYRGA